MIGPALPTPEEMIDAVRPSVFDLACAVRTDGPADVAAIFSALPYARVGGLEAALVLAAAAIDTRQTPQHLLGWTDLLVPHAAQAEFHRLRELGVPEFAASTLAEQKLRDDRVANRRRIHRESKRRTRAAEREAS